MKHEVAVVWACETKTLSWKLKVVTQRRPSIAQVEDRVYSAVCRAKNVILQRVEVELYCLFVIRYRQLLVALQQSVHSW